MSPDGKKLLEAIPIAEKLLAIRRKELGPENLDTAESLILIKSAIFSSNSGVGATVAALLGGLHFA
jgi:hypothetical protein